MFNQFCMPSGTGKIHKKNFFCDDLILRVKVRALSERKETN